MQPVIWNDRAEADLVELIGYVAAQNPPAAQRIHDLIRHYASQIARRPLAYRAGRIDGTRECIVHPNYIVVFQIGPDAVRIVRVLHATQQYP